MKKLENIIPTNYIEKLKAFKKLKEEIEELEKTFEEEFKNKLKRNKNESIEIDGVRFTYSKAYLRSVFDNAQFAVDHPNLYKKYTKEKKCNDSIKKTIL